MKAYIWVLTSLLLVGGAIVSFFADIETAKNILEGLFYITAIAAAVFSVEQYWLNSAQERARWLALLYQRFYDRPTLQEMRFKTVWNAGELAGLMNDPKLQGQLSEYLNFFELTAYLVRKGQLKTEEVQAMFESPLQKLPKIGPVWKYICDRGYEQLLWLLKELGYAPK